MRMILDTHTSTINGKELVKETFSVEGLSNHATDLIDGFAKSTKSSKTQPKTDTEIDYDALLKISQVRPTDEVLEDQACLLIENEGKNYVIGTLGNLSTITGRAKSKKTFAVSLAVAAAIANTTVLHRIKGQLPDDKKAVLLFDTEQSRHHVLRVVKRICRLCNTDDPPNLLVYSLRAYAPQDRLMIIDYAINNIPNLGLVFIDGIRDLAVDPVLDAEQASVLMTYLLQWTDKFKIHILCVLHQNKTDGNARGHLGTELINKSETVITVTRDANDKEVSIVAPEYCRDKEFEGFGFSVDETGLPFLIDGQNSDLSQPERKIADRAKKHKVTASSMTLETVKSIVTRAFSNDEYLSYGQLRTNLMEASQFFGESLIKNEVELLVTRVTQMSILTKVKTEKIRWEVYCINSDYLMNHVS